MATDKEKSTTKFMDEKNYLAKDYSSFKGELLSYARSYFVKQNADFSEASIGGMFVDLAAYIGDSMSYFLDYQFCELNPLTAQQSSNVLMHARNAGVKGVGPAPAVMTIKIYIEVPAEVDSNGDYVPQLAALPVIKMGTSCDTRSGPPFSTVEDLDFAEIDINGNYLASSMVSQLDTSGNPASYIMTREVIAVSGELKTQSVRIGAPTPFRKIILTGQNVTELLSIKDSDGNSYYEVDFLTQNTVFRKNRNYSLDQLEVESSLEIIPASRRFVREDNIQAATTTLTFGGSILSTKDDLIPDPSKLALPLFGKKTFTRFSIDPRDFGRTRSLGDAPFNTTLTIRYRTGGGLSHNVDAGDIDGFRQVISDFPRNPTATVSANVLASLDVVNEAAAAGGAPKFSMAGVKSLIQSARNQQSRIVTAEDLLSRIYTLPSQFGRVYRASLKKSTRNPLSSELYVLSRDRAGKLSIAPDTLKKNLSTYLNEFRLISDSIDVLDATVVNYGIEFSVVVTPDSNKETVTSACINSLMNVAETKNYQIDQPLVEADFINAIINTPGVLAMPSLIFFNLAGVVGTNVYSDYSYDLESNKFKGMIVGPPGSIFELRFITNDIIGSAE